MSAGVTSWSRVSPAAGQSTNRITPPRRFLSTSNRPRTSASQQNTDVLVAYLGIAIGTLAVFFVGCALAKLVSSWYAGGNATAGEALLATWKATPAVLAVWALTLIPLAISSAARRPSLPLNSTLPSITICGV